MKTKSVTNTVVPGLAIGILVLALIFGFVALGGLITMILWNLVIPALGGPHIGFWLAAGVNLLASWLFGRSSKVAK